jgi:hypothetical protein
MTFVGLLFLALLQGQAQDTESEKRPEQTKRIDLDFSDQYKMLSEDLERSLRWKHLFRVFGIAEVHIYPARESGPYLGPPLHIWGNGFGTSLWRDPVTGWPLQ